MGACVLGEELASDQWTAAFGGHIEMWKIFGVISCLLPYKPFHSYRFVSCHVIGLNLQPFRLDCSM